MFCVAEAHGYFAGESSKKNGLLMEYDSRNANQSEAGNKQNPVIKGKKQHVLFIFMQIDECLPRFFAKFKLPVKG